MIEAMSKELSKGYIAIISVIDADWLSKYKYHIIPDGYAVRNSDYNHDDYKKGINRYNIYMHREIYEHHFGIIPEGMQIDHINGDRLDNRIENLRLATVAQNRINRHKENRRKTTSKYKGVSWHKRDEVWEVYAPDEKGKRKYIGRFKDEVEAAKMFDECAKQAWGDRACLNFVDDKKEEEK